MSTIVSPDQQWKSFGSTAGAGRNADGSYGTGERRDGRDPWDGTDPRFDRRAHAGFAVAAEPYRPSATAPRPDLTPRQTHQAADAAEAVRPRVRFPVVDQGRFWVGAVLTSGVAALAGVIGIVIAQDLLKVPLSLASIGLAGAHLGTYGLVAALIALLAALAYDGMLAFAPRPAVYYGWLTGLLVALAVLLPFSAPVAIGSQLALGLINLVVGVAIMVLVPVAASNARNR